MALPPEAKVCASIYSLPELPERLLGGVTTSTRPIEIATTINSATVTGENTDKPIKRSSWPRL